MCRIPWLPARRSLFAAAALLTIFVAASILSVPAPVADAQAQPTILLGLTANNRINWYAPELPSVAFFSVPLTGIESGETILGIDNRPANGLLYGLGSANRLYTISPFTGVATRVGQNTLSPTLRGTTFGFDFNPVPDRIRVVGDARQNLRLNPDTGAVVDADPNIDGVQPDGNLAYDAADVNKDATPRLAGAAYTNSVAGATSTTNYAIDTGLDVLVTQGSAGGMPVSPNTGRLFTVGRLGVDASDAASFDITADGRAFAALTRPGESTSALYAIDLATGAARSLGTLGAGQVIRGLTVLR
jgi:hypothetical protein